MGAVAIAESISNSSSRMVRIFFNENRLLGNAGAAALVQAARRHPRLKRIGLSHCGLIGSDIANSLMELLEMNDIVERICVCGNSFEPGLENKMRSNKRFNFYVCGSESSTSGSI